ncbi:unnamed protein product [Owenia fusiformis]|uniref:Uncharacterized protein n=1 Tax=Owenia fusiformis TaxID=6347 RepID=A0A8J1XM72_OWEFU|nr:unnamed protein product [Owenia fusiformis]
MVKQGDTSHDDVGPDRRGEKPLCEVTDDINIVDRVSLFIDKHLRIVRYSSYVIAGVGLVSIARSLRLFTKFTAIRQIPDRFIQKHVTLRGTVTDIRGHLLLIDHIPIYQKPFYKWFNSSTCAVSSKLLPVSIGGTSLYPAGEKWLSEKMKNETIQFKLLTISGDGLNTDIQNSESASHKGMNDVVHSNGGSRDATFNNSANTKELSKEVLHCIVWSRKNIFRNICLNEHLIREGYAKVCHIENLPNDKLYIKFSERLLKIEINAEKKGKGVWKQPPLIERYKDYGRKKILTSKDWLRTKINVKDWVRKRWMNK